MSATIQLFKNSIYREKTCQYPHAGASFLLSAEGGYYNMIAKSMETCVEVLYELKKIDGQKRALLMNEIQKDNFAVYVEITNLLSLIG